MTHWLPDISTCATGNSSSRASVLERDGHAGIARPREQQEGLLFVPRRRRFGGFFSQRAVPRFRNHAGALRQAEHIQDERHFAVPHDARAGKGLNRLELFAQRLHHDFFGVVDLIHDQPELPLIGLHDHDVDRAVAFRSGTRIAQPASVPG